MLAEHSGKVGKIRGTYGVSVTCPKSGCGAKHMLLLSLKESRAASQGKDRQWRFSYSKPTASGSSTVTIAFRGEKGRACITFSDLRFSASPGSC